MSKDEKLGISNHLLENSPVNEKIHVEPMAKWPDKREKATRPLMPGQEISTLFCSNGKSDKR